MKHIVIVLGTRPEAIKLLPVYTELNQRPDVKTTLMTTGQHRELVLDVFRIFQCTPDVTLDVMRPNQTLASLSARVLSALDKAMPNDADIVVVQGDTASAFIGSLVAFYRGISCAHVEAGLRSGDMQSPFPEEFNRCAVALTARWHFAPTNQAAANLKADNVGGEVHVVGNTSIDAALAITSMDLPPSKMLTRAVTDIKGSERNIVLVTAHRRENFGKGIQSIISAIRQLAIKHPDLTFIWPVHPNPHVHKRVHQELARIGNIRLLEPLDYSDLLQVMQRAFIALSDSGGIQEEAPSFACPVLVLRDNTERPEAISAGCNVLVGTDIEKIIETFESISNDINLWRRMTNIENPYGDGATSKRIADILVASSSMVEPNQDV